MDFFEHLIPQSCIADGYVVNFVICFLDLSKTPILKLLINTGDVNDSVVDRPYVKFHPVLDVDSTAVDNPLALGEMQQWYTIISMEEMITIYHPGL